MSPNAGLIPPRIPCRSDRRLGRAGCGQARFRTCPCMCPFRLRLERLRPNRDSPMSQRVQRLQTIVQQSAPLQISGLPARRASRHALLHTAIASSQERRSLPEVSRYPPAPETAEHELILDSDARSFSEASFAGGALVCRDDARRLDATRRKWVRICRSGRQ
jgi:hypothetical protein